MSDPNMIARNRERSKPMHVGAQLILDREAERSTHDMTRPNCEALPVLPRSVPRVLFDILAPLRVLQPINKKTEREQNSP